GSPPSPVLVVIRSGAGYGKAGAFLAKALYRDNGFRTTALSSVSGQRPDSDAGVRDHRETPRSMSAISAISLATTSARCCPKSGESHQDHAGRDVAGAHNHVAEILVRRDEERVVCIGERQHVVVTQPGSDLLDRIYNMPILAQQQSDRMVDAC